MELHPETSRLLADLQMFSGSKLTRTEDLGLLLELGGGRQPGPKLNELAFLAKFVSRAYGILQRVGKNGTGYSTLLSEFNSNLTTCVSLMREILAGAPPAVSRQFEASYLAMNQEGVGNCLALLYDLSWYKNWRIDNHEG